MTDTLIREVAADLLGHAEAVFSADEAYRYLLIRRWAVGGTTATFLMLNPSTATATADDPTIRRCIGYARREGCNALTVVNLFALRATNPAHLLPHPDPVGERNDEFIVKHCLPGRLVVAAWGYQRRVGPPRALHVRRLLADSGVDLQCLGKTLTGEPRHPLFVRADAPLIRYAR
jgi:hypothetical protein